MKCIEFRYISYCAYNEWNLNCMYRGKEGRGVKKHAVAICLFLLAILMGVLSYPYLPNQMPTHWGVDGTADEFANKEVVICIFPAVMIVLYSSFRFTMHYVYARYAGKGVAHSIITYAILLFLLFLHTLILLIGLGWKIDFNTWLLGGSGVFFLVIGWSFQKLEYKDSIALSLYENKRPTLFQKTQLYSTRAFQLMGLGILVSLFLTNQVRLYTTIGIIGIGSLLLIGATLYYYVTDNHV